MTANSSNIATFIDEKDGKLVQVWPCHCGERHERIEEFIEHNCLHAEITIHVDEHGEPMLVCACGKVWWPTLEGLTPIALKEFALWALKIVNPIAEAGVTFIDKDGSEHIWPCESHRGVIVKPNEPLTVVEESDAGPKLTEK